MTPRLAQVALPRRLRRRRWRARASSVAARVREDRLTYLDERKIASLVDCLEDVDRAGVPGDVYEAGVALGGSAILLATLIGRRRRFRGYDVFEQIPPPSERDEEDAHSRYGTIAEGSSEGIGGDRYYGYMPDLHDEVVRAFERYGLRVDGDRISLHKGLFDDTLEPDGPVALAHVDCDWHDPVQLCLERIYPRLSEGGYVVLDDYNDYSGCRTATDAFLLAHRDLEVVRANPHLVARRIANREPGVGSSREQRVTSPPHPRANPRTTVGDPVRRAGEVSFSVAGPFGEHRVRFWGDVPASQALGVESALASALLPAMTIGGELSLPGRLSPQLRRALPNLQAVLASLAVASRMTDDSLSTVEVTTPGASASPEPQPDPAPRRGVGAFFSCGVDSWSTLLSNPDVTDLIYIHGFDILLDQPQASATVERQLAKIAEGRGMRLHVVRTNLRDLLDPNVPWEISHGVALASVALLFAPLCERLLISAGMTYGGLVDRGSHPLHDHLWSTERCRIEHFGAHLTRSEKTELLAECQEALDTLRVCWRHVDRYNCGRCEKCLRTMVALEAVGALDRCPTFGAPLDLDAVAELELSDPDLLIWWGENLDLARRHGATDVAAAVEACLAANRPPPTDGSAELAAAEARAEALGRELALVRSSRSWRLTAPLRRIGSAARRVSRRGAGA
jgi:O-methyltransferase